jgi:hypothetical protein
MENSKKKKFTGMAGKYVHRIIRVVVVFIVVRIRKIYELVNYISI